MVLHQWFQKNRMTFNPENGLSNKIMLNNNEITSSNEEKLLGILLDSKLN